ncbi:MAG TPA: 5-dehydro-2-deoxygluconokinase [Gaiellaceae bacterium]
MGRVSVDLYPEQIGVPLAQVRTFRKMLGGSPTNVAVAAARLGRRATVVTKVGTDGFGDYVREALAGFGVDPSLVGTDPELRTPLAFCELHPPDDFPLLFYRQPTAPDLQLRDVDLAAAPITEVPLLWMTGTGLSEEPSRSATLGALRRRAARAHTVFDLDYRPMLWREDATPFYREAASFATVLIGNREEWDVLGEVPDGVDVAIEKLGPEGVRGTRGGETVVVPPIEVDVVNGLGAGDAFGGALCHGLLAGWELERLLRFANAAGALVASRLGCADEMPSLAEVEELLCAA